MQKKVIALAVAGLVSGAAFAQTSVVFGGIVDMGYSYKSSFSTSGTAARSAVDQGGQDGSRLFWKATEDLGNGLSVSAEQQLRMAADTRTAPVADASVLTLAGKSWGAIRAGNYGSVADDINGYSETGMGWGNGVFDITPVDTTYNVIGYVTPDFSGFQAKLNYSTNDKGVDDANGNGTVNVRSYGLNGSYIGNGLKLGAAYQRRAAATGLVTTAAVAPTVTDPIGSAALYEAYKTNEWLLSGSYTFGQFSVGAGYDREKTSMDNDSLTRKAWRINGGFAITPNDQVSLSYSRLKYNDQDGGVAKASGYGVSYSHMLSKRTNVYASYGHISQSDSTALYAIDNGNGPLDATYKSMFKVGMRHQF